MAKTETYEAGREKVLQLLEKFPETPSRTLARMLHRDWPLLFLDVEQARSVLRYYRGCIGKANRDRLSDETFVMPKKTIENPMGLPKSDIESFPPYIVDPSLKRGLVLYDVHVPYHVPAVIEMAVRAAKEFKVDHVLLPGDLVDCYELSDFEKDPRKRRFAHEIIMARQLLVAVHRELKAPKIIVSEGNHEARYSRKLRVSAPALIGIQEYRFNKLLHLDEIDADWVDNKRIIMEGRLAIFHGHELSKWGIGGVNPARTLYLKTKATAMAGHCHQHSVYQEKDMYDNIHTCWTVGCACELRPRYSPLNNWTHGFALIEKDKSGWFQVQSKRILGGRVV